MSSSPVFRLGFSIEELKELRDSLPNPQGIQSKALRTAVTRIITQIIKSDVGIGSPAYIKSNAPKSDADKILDAFGSEAQKGVIDPTSVDWDSLTAEVIGSTCPADSSLGEDSNEPN